MVPHETKIKLFKYHLSPFRVVQFLQQQQQDNNIKQKGKETRNAQDVNINAKEGDQRKSLLKRKTY